MRPAAELSTQHSTRSARFYQTAAQLAAQAADALEHAHQFDVIHRDVKPANLIVDERGNVWVTDFGLAQFHTSQGLTRTGDLMGTLRYMSPEQAAGRHGLLDARTDVYSLGATLYELLTLQPLFDGADAQRLLHQILHEEARPLRSQDRSVPPELETIVLKAVAKSPADRYPTAREFADDLRRFLDHRPILARPPSLAQRARKWARRHPSVVVAAVLLCVLTTAGSLLGAWMIHQEQQKTLQRAVQAENALKLARQSADEMIQISEEELAGKPFMEWRPQADAPVRPRVLSKPDMRSRPTTPTPRAELGAARGAREQDPRRPCGAARGRPRGPVEPGRREGRDDLGLTAEQHDGLEGLLQRMDQERKDGFADFCRLSAEAKQQRLLDDARAHESAVNRILSAGQQQRLKQIALQLQGLSAFHDAEVVAALGLTAEQKRRLQEVEADAFAPGPEPGRGPRNGPEQGARAAETFVAGLTEAQKRRWNDMTGEPFKGCMRPFGPPPPDGPPHGPDPHGPPHVPPGAAARRAGATPPGGRRSVCHHSLFSSICSLTGCTKWVEPFSAIIFLACSSASCVCG